ncbi:MAG: DinB family protein [Candidatus Bathyarchaeota archaeon]|nr:MAG: DinB family protein [Candidatus Bathyarchaeota archaeon]
MSEKGEVLEEMAEFAFDSIASTCEGIDEKELDWRPVPESNNIRWILNHLARIANLSLPRIIKGDQSYTPEGWPEDYRDQTYTMEKMLADIDAGKKVVLKGLKKLTSEDLEAEIPLWRGTRKRKVGVYAYIGELINHKGQIAALKGNIKRRREKDPEFLK